MDSFPLFDSLFDSSRDIHSSHSMAPMKSVARSATVAFSPTVDVLAMGAMAGTLNASLSSVSSLECFQIDFSQPASDLDLLGSYKAGDEFHRLSWSTAGAGSDDLPYGLLAGSLADGTVCVWNPAPCIRKEKFENSLLTKMHKHIGRVRGLEFNVITPNFLASGGDEGDIFIWDLQEPTSTSHYPPLKAGRQEQIVDLSWNRKAHLILATTSNSGATMVWDLRKQRLALSISDPNNRRASAAVEWNPDGATELLIASADDRFPTLQVWDLRNSISPVKELRGHTKGIVTMAWCPMDSGLLLSSGKDCRTLCWDTSSAEIISELPASSNWTFDVQWSPRIAGVFSTSSYDGEVNLYNVEACKRILASDGHFGGGPTASMRAPKWLKRPVGVCFGFGGKLASFSSPVTEVKIETVVSEEEIVSHLKDLEAVMTHPENKQACQNFCQKKIENSGSENDKELWSFLKIMFEENAHKSLLNQLGPDVKENVQDGFSSGGVDKNAQLVANLNLSNGIMDENPSLGYGADLDKQTDSIDDGADFFDNIFSPKGAISQSAAFCEKGSIEESIVLQEDEHDGLDEEDEYDKAIDNALVVGDFKGCVKHCLAADRLDDALIIARYGGSELWEETKTFCQKKHRRPYWKVFSAIVSHDIRPLVNSRSLNDWKGTLRMIFRHADSQEFSPLCNLLAERLLTCNTQAATLCYICAANLEGLARLWYQQQLLKCNGCLFIKELQEIVEQVVMLVFAKGDKHIIPTLARLVTSYAELLISQGIVAGAINYLDLLQIDESPENLKERILRLKEIKGTSSQSPAQDWSQGSTQPAYTTELAYVPAGQEDSLLQPGVFYPTPTDAQYWSQPPATMHQVPYAPLSAKPIYPSGATSGPVPNHLFSPVPVVAPTQFATNVEGSAPTDHNSWRDRANPPAHGIPVPGPFQQGLDPSQLTSDTRFRAPNPSVLATPVQHGFMPVSASRAQHHPQTTTAPMDPQTPHLSSPREGLPTAMPVALVTIQTVDVSGVPDDLKPVIASLLRLYTETSEALGGVRAVPAKRREIDDNSRKIGSLFAKLNNSDISPTVRGKLIQICQALDAGDYATATKLQMSLVTSDWDECGSWLGPLKRMIKTRQGSR